MQRIIKSFVTISALSSLVVPILFSSNQAFAGEKGTNASYVGAGVTAGVTNGGHTNDGAIVGGNLTGRLKLGNTPFSARSQIYFSDKNSAITPNISADVGIAKNTNAYLGVGYQFVQNKGTITPNGNDNGVALVAGVESQVAKNFMVYSNATLGVNAYKNSPASAVSISSGVGVRF